MTLLLISVFILTNFILVLKISYFAKLLNLIDFSKNKIHAVDTPKFGFFLFSSSIIFFSIYFLLIKSEINFIYIIFYFFSFFIIGYLDDKYEINVIWRFIFALLTISIFFYLNQNNYYISNSFSLELNFILLCFFTLGFIHLVNITDGINGLVSSLFLYSLIYYFFKGYEDLESHFQFIMIISMIGISIYLIPNFLGYCFLGNIGSYLIAIIVSIIYLELYSQSILEYSDILLIFFIPLIDGLRVTFLRIYHKKNPFKGDFSHFHHKIRGDKFMIFIYFFIIFYPSLINFFFRDYTIYIAMISFVNYFFMYKIYQSKSKILNL